MNQVKIYLGMRGTGKSTNMLNDLKMQSRVIVYDTLIEETYGGFRRITRFKDLCQAIKDNPSFFRIAYHGIDDGTEMEIDFDYATRAIYCCRNLVFAVEEIGLHCSSHKMPIGLQSIVAAGRHRDLSFFCTSQRASNVHPLIRALSTDIVSYHQDEPIDVQCLAERMGEKAYGVKTLALHDCIKWNAYDSVNVHTQNPRVDNSGETSMIDTS